FGPGGYANPSHISVECRTKRSRLAHRSRPSPAHPLGLRPAKHSTSFTAHDWPSSRNRRPDGGSRNLELGTNRHFISSSVRRDRVATQRDRADVDVATHPPSRSPSNRVHSRPSHTGG